MRIGYIPAVFALVLSAASAVQAQSFVSLGITGGPSSYDLSGTGTAPFVAAQVDATLRGARAIVLEGSIEWFRYDTDFSGHRTYIIPEAMVQFQIPARVVRPYLGAAVGRAFASGSNVIDASTLTLAAAGGVRVGLASRVGLRGELRVRAVHPFTGTMADFGLGLSYGL